MVTSLKNWPHHQVAEVVEVVGEAWLNTRLQDLGIAPGVSIEVLMVMPFSGPLIVRTQGATLALRQGEAACIQVQAYKMSS